MDVVILLRYVPEATPTVKLLPLSLVEKLRPYATTKTLPDFRMCDTLATRLQTSLSRWYNANDFFANRTTLETFARFTIILTEQIAMVKHTKAQANFQRTEWKGFVDVILTPEQLVEADSWKCTALQAFEAVHALNMEGYGLSISYSSVLSASTATLKAGKSQGVADGYGLSARGDNSFDALKLLLYKHHYVMSRDWAPYLATKPKASRG